MIFCPLNVASDCPSEVMLWIGHKPGEVLSRWRHCTDRTRSAFPCQIVRASSHRRPHSRQVQLNLEDDRKTDFHGLHFLGGDSLSIEPLRSSETWTQITSCSCLHHLFDLTLLQDKNSNGWLSIEKISLDHRRVDFYMAAVKISIWGWLPKNKMSLHRWYVDTRDHPPLFINGRGRDDVNCI